MSTVAPIIDRRTPRAAGRFRSAVLIACKNGEPTIAATVRSAMKQADVYVLSDGSTDRTAEVAEAAGATVIARSESGGKPDSLRVLMRQHALVWRYDYIAVLDDDTIVADDYVDRLVEVLDRSPNVAVASGRIDSRWERDQRWNPYIAMRAFMYWSYQATVKRGQNALHLVNVICGANSLFRAEIFAALVEQDAPYAIDDMFWLAEIARRRLGRVAYVHGARSWTIDPHTFRDWYRQTVRWSWGQFQSVRGHRLGMFVRRDRARGRFAIRFSWFDFGYLALLVDWLPYMLEPFLFAPAAYFFSRWVNPLWFVGAYLVTSVGWIVVAAVALRRPRLLVLAPAILALDLIYRLTMLHALVKAIFRPSVDVCRWDSPERFAVDPAAATSPTN